MTERENSGQKTVRAASMYSLYLSFWFSSFSCMTSLVALASSFHAASSVCVSNADGGSRSTLSWSVYTSKIHTHFAYLYI